ncbi:MAG: hypothetical protein OCD01_03780 [Fibrobacterales bacterium]
MTYIDNKFYQSVLCALFNCAPGEDPFGIALEEVSLSAEKGELHNFRFGMAAALKRMAHLLKGDKNLEGDYAMSLIYAREVISNNAISYERLHQILMIMGPVSSKIEHEVA